MFGRIIKDSLNKMYPTPSTLAELETAVQTIWDGISLQYIQSLYQTAMLRRMKLCVKSKGNPIKY